jgi:DNA mismatch endonuclease (patch repair protein)
MTHYQRDGRAPIPESVKTSKVMSANRGKDTGPEISLRKALWAKGIRGYRVHPKDLPGRPDIVFPRYRLAILVNGCFWHRCPHCMPSTPKSHTDFWNEKFKRNIERDSRVIMELQEIGWRTIVVWECSIRSNVHEVVKNIGDEIGVE